MIATSVQQSALRLLEERAPSSKLKKYPFSVKGEGGMLIDRVIAFTAAFL